ncbi:hypothetical protein RhiirC2_847957 [Rhizophagus irregularis]|uniref:Uncharacterized protein n=1 Tax=Rhizophagus irregularis TaxID=588596 RepID=A0A2N1NGM0_9GLOM|nr:hypothetical protein RhiirC2_847957 [Rhizophagus irregularis]
MFITKTTRCRDINAYYLVGLGGANVQPRASLRPGQQVVAKSSIVQSEPSALHLAMEVEVEVEVEVELEVEDMVYKWLRTIDDFCVSAMFMSIMSGGWSGGASASGSCGGSCSSSGGCDGSGGGGGGSADVI